MTLRLYFSSHARPLSAVASRLLSHADIVVLENATCDDVSSKENLFNRVSDGTLTEDEGFALFRNIADPEFLRSILKQIYNTKRLVYVEHSPLSSYELQPVLAPPPRLYRSFGEASNQIETWIRSSANTQKRRDKQLARQLADLVKRHRNEEILAILGSGHQYPLERFLNNNVTYRSYRLGKPTFFEMTVSQFEVGRSPSQSDLMRVIAELYLLGGRSDLIEADLTKVRRRILLMSRGKLKTFVTKNVLQ
jgi:hypothetical protein